MIDCCLHPLCHPQYFFCLLLIFTIELVAGVLAYVYYQKVSDHLCVPGSQPSPVLRGTEIEIILVNVILWFVFLFFFVLLLSWM